MCTQHEQRPASGSRSTKRGLLVCTIAALLIAFGAQRPIAVEASDQALLACTRVPSRFGRMFSGMPVASWPAAGDLRREVLIVTANLNAGGAQRSLVTVAGARFDVHPSGTRFLMLETAAPSVEPPLTRPVVLLGWRNVLESRKPLPL